QLWAGKVDLIKTGAEQYGDENKNLLEKTCKKSDGTTVGPCCVEVTVQNLIDKGFVTTKEKDINGKLVIKNDAEKDKEKKIVNDNKVNICLENNVVYSEFKN
ncbi:MAG: hypothetical protein RR478_03545, partial [Bacilli bacterium]